MTPEGQNFKALNAVHGTTDRFRYMDKLEAYLKDLQDDWKTVDWEGRRRPEQGWRDPQPITEIWAPEGYAIIDRRSRRPTVRRNVAREIVDTFTNFLFAEERFPEVRVEGDPESEEWLRNALADAGFRSAMTKAREHGGSMGTAVVTFKFVDGRLQFEVHNPKHVQVLAWENATAYRVGAIRIEYQYPTDESDTEAAPDGKGVVVKQVWRWYRRDITSEADILYDNPKVEPNEIPQFNVVAKVEHGMGRFPGIWIQNRRCVSEQDGYADYEDALDLFDEINMESSQLARSLKYCGDPELVLKVLRGRSVGTLKRSPEKAIVLETGPDGEEKAEYLELSGESLKLLDENVEKLKAQAKRQCGVVPISSEDISGAALSAKAMEYLWQPTIAETGKLRVQYGDMGIVPLLDTLLFFAKKQRVDKGATFAHKGKLGTVDPKETRVTLRWGRYFAPTFQDILDAIKVAVEAETAGYVAHDTAMESVAHYFGVRDIEAEKKKIAKSEAADPELVKRFREAAAGRDAARNGKVGQRGEDDDKEPAGKGDDEGGRFRGAQ